MEKHYYKVTCRRGHCGRHRYVPITFYFAAANALQAARMGQKQPGVKHTELPLACQEVSWAEYERGRKISAYHRYESCTKT